MSYACLLEELAELRTCSSIIGIACARIIKNKLPDLKKDANYNNIKILDETLTRLNESIVKLESIISELE
jgi:hypothetical protein